MVRLFIPFIYLALGLVEEGLETEDNFTSECLKVLHDCLHGSVDALPSFVVLRLADVAFLKLFFRSEPFLDKLFFLCFIDFPSFLNLC